MVCESSSGIFYQYEAILKKSNYLIADSKDIDSRWYTQPKPPPPVGWRLFSTDFVLQNLQGCFGRPTEAKRTWGWRMYAYIAVLCLIIGQATIAFCSRIPFVSSFVWFVARGMGRSPIGFLMRGAYCKTRFKSLGQDTLIDPGLTIWGADRIEIGSRCVLSMNIQLSCGRGEDDCLPHMRIGDYCFIGPGVVVGGGGNVSIGDFAAISAGAHIYSTTAVPVNPAVPGQLMSMSHGAPIDQRHSVTGPVEIGDYAFIGIHSVVLPNVVIGKGAIIHSFTEVRSSVPPYANIVGPGKGIQRGWRQPLRIDPRNSPATEAKQLPSQES
jgi:acetyltransferase-like isoleucine patch superfamily enzyme